MEETKMRKQEFLETCKFQALEIATFEDIMGLKFSISCIGNLQKVREILYLLFWGLHLEKEVSHYASIRTTSYRMAKQVNSLQCVSDES